MVPLTSLKRGGAALLLLSPMFLQGCGCGFDCSDNDDNDAALLSLSLSDALPEELSEVVIELDAITLRRAGGDIVIDNFTVDGADATSLSIDLLDYRGVARTMVVEDLEIERGTYSGIELTILGGDPNLSYVREEESGRQLQLDPVRNFSLPGFTARSGTQEYVIEFGLSRALNQSSDDTYVLSTEGVMVLDITRAAELRGQVDPALFDAGESCRSKDDSTVGNRVYLYQGQSLGASNLGDVFTIDSSTEIPDATAAPFAATEVFGSDRSGIWEFAFGYLPEGDYTIAFACNSEADDAIDYDGITIAEPAEQQYTVTLDEGSITTCNLTEAADCQ